MTRVRRLLLVLAALASIALLNSGQSLGDNTKKDGLLPQDSVKPAGNDLQPAPLDAEAALAKSKFDMATLLTYQPANGDPYFALQVKPDLAAAPRRPRDYLVMVATDASQA